MLYLFDSLSSPQWGAQSIDKPIFPVWGCMKGPQPLHIQSAAAACTQQGWKPFGLPSRQRRPRTAKSKILTPRRRSGPSGRFLYHFTSRPNLGFAGLGFRFCGALWAVLEPPAAQSAAQTIDKPIFPVWGCMKGPQPLHIQSAGPALPDRGAAQVAASFIIFFLAPTSASPGWGSGSAGPFGPSSNLQPRKRGLRLLAPGRVSLARGFGPAER